MADLLSDFESYFTASSLLTSWTLTKDIMLDIPDNAIAISEYAGETGIPQVSSALRSIQIAVRSKSAPVAKAKINELYTSLKTDDGILDLTTTRWTGMNLRQPPFQYKVDKLGRSYYCFNIGVTTYED